MAAWTDVIMMLLYSDLTGLEATLQAQFVDTADANVGTAITNTTNPGTFKEKGVATAQYRVKITVPSGFIGTLDIKDGSGNFLSAKAYNGVEEKTLALAGLGTGDVPVNHHTGGTDNLQYLVGGIPVDGGDVRAYLLADYNANNLSTPYIKGQTKTGPVFDGTNTRSGRWLQPMMLFSGLTYIIMFTKPGSAQLTTAQITVP